MGKYLVDAIFVLSILWALYDLLLKPTRPKTDECSAQEAEERERNGGLRDTQVW